MKNKLFILISFMLLTGVVFGQASGSSDFFISVQFEKNIPVEEIEAYYYQASNNNIDRVNIKPDRLKNTIEILGHHSYVVGAGLPVIVFSHKGKKIYDSHFAGSTRVEKEETVVQNLYYLVTSRAGFSTVMKIFVRNLNSLTRSLTSSFGIKT
ncbi:hypothetical protein [Sphingobacterium multivorum]|uniref:hypothetical protein n=1 Tax=Sphingobacterium multivorum TaxID=28454 RepID=UPI003DA52E96